MDLHLILDFQKEEVCSAAAGVCAGLRAAWRRLISVPSADSAYELN